MHFKSTFQLTFLETVTAPSENFVQFRFISVSKCVKNKADPTFLSGVSGGYVTSRDCLKRLI